MEIIKNKRKCKCKMCFKPITLKYKVRYSGAFYHLSCFYRWNERRLETSKKYKKILNRKKKIMILESL